MTQGQGGGCLRGAAEHGYAMAVLLTAIAVMTVLMSATMPVWRQLAQREREEELIFRGEQYARAVSLFQRKYGGGLPPSVDVLVEQRLLRKKYADPMTPDGAFQVLYQSSLARTPGQPTGPGTTPATPAPGAGPGPDSPAPRLQPGGRPSLAGAQGGIVGVVSKSTASSIKVYQGRSKYNEWQFLYSTIRIGAGLPAGVGAAAGRPGQPTPGRGRPGAPGVGRPSTSGRPPTASRPVR